MKSIRREACTLNAEHPQHIGLLRLVQKTLQFVKVQ